MTRALFLLVLVLAACRSERLIQPNPLPDKVWVIPSPDGDENRVSLQSEPEHAAKERVSIRRGLMVRKDEPRGLLEITSRFPTGELYGRGGYVTIYPTGPLDLKLPHRKLQYSEHHPSAWAKIWLPPGEYNVIVTSGDYVPSCGVGWTPTLQPFGHVETVVTIEEGETTELNAVLKGGGRIRLRVDDEESEVLEYLVHLIGEDAPDGPLSFYEYEEYPAFPKTHYVGGSTSLSSDIIPVGLYTLECVTPDGETARARIRIGDGKVTEILVRF